MDGMKKSALLLVCIINYTVPYIYLVLVFSLVRDRPSVRTTYVYDINEVVTLGTRYVR